MRPGEPNESTDTSTLTDEQKRFLDFLVEQAVKSCI